MTGRIEIRLAARTDEDDILRSLDVHWREDHIFVTEPELMRWQHHDPEDPSGLTFVIAVRQRREQEEILGVLGFIPFWRFDPGSKRFELTLAIWKVRDDTGVPGLGLQLLKFIERRFQPTMIAAIGVSQIAHSIYSVLGYTVGRLSQYALFSAKPAQDPVAEGVKDEMRRPRVDSEGARLLPFGREELTTWQRRIDDLGESTVPRKSVAYLLNRFISHPYYSYDLRGIIVEHSLQAVLVLRRVPVPDCGPNTAVLRIVDMIGDEAALAQVGGSLQDLLDELGCDHVDIMCYGPDPETFRKAGFVDRDRVPGLILPNYFEPFVATNVDIDLAFRLTTRLDDHRIRLMRADSDQDRPNVGPLAPKRAFVMPETVAARSADKVGEPSPRGRRAGR